MLSTRDIQRLGHGLHRPECVLCTAGEVVVSHVGGGVTRLLADGSQRDVLGPGNPTVATNGFAIGPDGSFLCANLLPPGGVWRIRDGEQEPLLTEVDGEPLLSVNFVHADRDERLWISVSTRRQPRARGYRPDVRDGFVVLLDQRGARIVADGLRYTNEARVDPRGRYLYVNETFGRRTSRFVLTNTGLGPRETVAEYGPGTFPDGLEFDQEGGLWITSILSNRVIRIHDRQQTVILEDSDPEHLARIEQAFQAGELERPHMDSVPTTLKSLSSLAFGGPARKTVYLGNLLDDCIYTFPSPVAGAEPPHWHTSL